MPTIDNPEDVKNPATREEIIKEIEADNEKDSVSDRQLADRKSHWRADPGQRLLFESIPFGNYQEGPAVFRNAQIYSGDVVHNGRKNCRDQGAASFAQIWRV